MRSTHPTLAKNNIFGIANIITKINGYLHNRVNYPSIPLWDVKSGEMILVKIVQQKQKRQDENIPPSKWQKQHIK
ncbi:hypothetical protein PN36_20440 [Candidatus Thiomargarita nelsonii]|uniref:Uncharacterized protein n=1 Tax=Candidatus Thiomargarita nelsonii TaxID=1003181 RepID=A0A0A6PME9_9GAMM|nr:hypothetical protein PN36_20440 [Candidatus Thiomargarita nelsonii]